MISLVKTLEPDTVLTLCFVAGLIIAYLIVNDND